MRLRKVAIRCSDPCGNSSLTLPRILACHVTYRSRWAMSQDSNSGNPFGD